MDTVCGLQQSMTNARPRKQPYTKSTFRQWYSLDVDKGIKLVTTQTMWEVSCVYRIMTHVKWYVGCW